MLCKQKFIQALKNINHLQIYQQRQWNTMYKNKTCKYWNAFLYYNFIEDYTIYGISVDFKEFNLYFNRKLGLFRSLHIVVPELPLPLSFSGLRRHDPSNLPNFSFILPLILKAHTSFPFPLASAEYFEGTLKFAPSFTREKVNDKLLFCRHLHGRRGKACW